MKRVARHLARWKIRSFNGWISSLVGPVAMWCTHAMLDTKILRNDRSWWQTLWCDMDLLIFVGAFSNRRTWWFKTFSFNIYWYRLDILLGAFYWSLVSGIEPSYLTLKRFIHKYCLMYWDCYKMMSLNSGHICNCNPAKILHHSEIFIITINLKCSLRIIQFAAQFANEWWICREHLYWMSIFNPENSKYNKGNYEMLN